MAQQNHNQVFDSALELTDAGLIAASAAGVVDSVAKVLDLGLAFWSGRMVIDATAVEVDSGDEIYRIAIQLSNSATFASGIVEGASIAIGDAVPLAGDTDLGVGRYEVPFTNEVNGTLYRYARVYTTIAGTIATGVNFTAFATKD